MRIRGRSKHGRAIGENFGRRAQLAMGFQADNCFVLSFGWSRNRHRESVGFKTRRWLL